MTYNFINQAGCQVGDSLVGKDSFPLSSAYSVFKLHYAPWGCFYSLIQINLASCFFKELLIREFPVTLWHFKITYSLDNNFLCCKYKASKFLNIYLTQNDSYMKYCWLRWFLPGSMLPLLSYLNLFVTLSKRIFKLVETHYTYVSTICWLFKMCNIQMQCFFTEVMLITLSLILLLSKFHVVLHQMFYYIVQQHNIKYFNSKATLRFAYASFYFLN